VGVLFSLIACVGLAMWLLLHSMCPVAFIETCIHFDGLSFCSLCAIPWLYHDYIARWHCRSINYQSWWVC